LKLLLVSLLFISSLFGFGTAIDWMSNLEHAKELAKRDKKPILLFIHSTACFYCGVLEQKVFPDVALQKRLKKDFILLALDASTGSDSIEEDINDQAPARFITSVTPAFFFMGPEEEKLASRGEKHMTIYGYWTIDELNEWSDDALAKFKKYYGDKYK